MKILTKQEMFDIAARGILAQGGPSVERHPKPNAVPLCMYRGDNGRKCAVGHMIPDHVYVPDMDNGEWTLEQIVKHLGTFGIEVDENFARELQEAHDQGSSDANYMDGFKDRMRSLAYHYDVSAAVLDEVPIQG